MATIYTRATKGSALTWTEGDDNITNLNNDKIEDIVEDTTPQLGGDLDVNGNSIVSVSNGNIAIAPNGTGSVVLDGQNWPQAAPTTNDEYLTATAAGQLSWTDSVRAKTIYENVKNVSGGSLAKGTPVTQVGIAGAATVTVEAARADDPTKLAIGVLNETLADDAEGQMTILGEIRGVNTSGFTVGDKVYLGATGGFTNVKPTATDVAVQFLGVVFRVDASTGSGFITGTLVEDSVRWTGTVFQFWDGSDWVSAGGGISDVVADTTPQLGGDLDVNGNSIVSASNGNISITPNGTGTTTIKNAQLSGEVRLLDDDASNFVGFKSPATVTTNRIWTLPAADGSNGEVLSTNGTGVLAWITPGVTPNVQVFTTPGTSTWIKPAGCTQVLVYGVGAGGGGGSGCRNNFTANRGGGGGGSGAGIAWRIFAAADLLDEVSVIVGAGGTGGASRTSNSDGLSGAAGGDTEFGGILLVSNGSAGGGGSGGGSNSAAGFGLFNSWPAFFASTGQNGAAGRNTTGFSAPNLNSVFNFLAASGGGGGGGAGSSVSTAAAGGAGGAFANNASIYPGGLGGSGTGTAAQRTGGNGPVYTAAANYPQGMGGGGGAFKNDDHGGAGGNGGDPGGGGGGGAGANAGWNSGAGGNGGNGRILVISW
jgi:hypothetical protein